MSRVILYPGYPYHFIIGFFYGKLFILKIIRGALSVYFRYYITIFTDLAEISYVPGFSRSAAYRRAPAGPVRG